PVAWDQVRSLNEMGAAVPSRALAADPPPAHEVPYLQDSQGLGGSEVGVLGGAVAAIVLIEAVLLIGPAFAVGARRSARQLALVAAAGGDRRTLRRIVLLGGVVTGLAASVAGAVAGLALAAVARP